MDGTNFKSQYYPGVQALLLNGKKFHGHSKIPFGLNNGDLKIKS